MATELYFEIINAVVSIFILIMIVYILWIMKARYHIVRSVLFLKGDKLKNPTIIISFAILLFVIRESYKATRLIGYQTSELLVELLEMGTIFLMLIGVYLVFSLFWKRRNPNILQT